MPISRTVSGLLTEPACDSITLEPPPKQPYERVIALELSEETVGQLEREHLCFSREANPALPWDRFLQACVAIGLERLKEISALEALESIERLES